MKRSWRWALVIACAALLAGGYAFSVVSRGFSAKDEPSALEAHVARAARNWAVASRARDLKNPLEATAQNVQEGRERFATRCSLCHAVDGTGRSSLGPHLYPRAPDLSGAATQALSDGELHEIICNGVRLTGMPAMATSHEEHDHDAWKLLLFIRSVGGASPVAAAARDPALSAAHFVGSARCEKCHSEIFRRWQKTPMANVVRDPKQHPEAIIPDLSTNTIAPFARDDVAFVYGSLWKQRYFTKVGDDYFPEGAQWDIQNKVWRAYHVADGTDWWVPFYPKDNLQRPTGPTCDGCHSVDYNLQTRQVVEWNVGCERCHGPGSAHLDNPVAHTILNPSRLGDVASNDTCIQCHSQGRPLTNPIEGRTYDWPVGYRVGLDLKDFWRLEDHKLGETTFTHYADGTAHKNRMQGNDFVQSLMYRRGVTCASCHDAHGTDNPAQLREPIDKLCLDCHGPGSPNGPRTATLEEHTHHRAASTGSACVSCHMPAIETTIADVKVHAHTFAFITPAMTERYGIANPCTSCHADKTAAWATEALGKWPERSPWRLE